MKQIIGSFVIVLLAFSIKGQVAGTNTYDFLEIVHPARIAALGGANISIADDDANIASSNPALLNKEMDKYLALNFVNYIAGINYGNVSFTKDFDSIGTFQANLIYANYGKFKYAEANGELSGGTFSANDLALNFGYSRPIDTNFSIGANLKLLNSVIESYNSFGMAVDVAGAYVNKKRMFSAALMVRNVGMQFKSYVQGNKEKLPFEIQAGFSKRLKYAPFRLSLTFENLQKWDLTQVNPNLKPETDPLTGDVIPIKQPGFLDKAARHIVVGGELLLTKNVHIRGGFNYRRRAELRLTSRPALTGFTVGLGFRINKFHLSYARSSYHRAGGTNSISITTNLGAFRSQK